MSTGLKIAGIGEVLFDVFPEKEAFGGAPANFACHCSFLGAESYVISCIGSDLRGGKAEAFLRDHGANVEGLAVSRDYETGVVIVTLDSDGKPDYEIKEGVAWDYIPWTSGIELIAGRLDAVCFGSLAQRSIVSRNTIHRFLRLTKPECLKIFDINLRQRFYDRDIIISSLEAASALKLNDEELPFVADILGLSGSEEAMMKMLAERFNLRLCVLTCGSKGALMVAPGQVSFRNPDQVKVINTVGAGDSFTAAVVVDYLRGHSLDDINRHANAVAGYVCTQVGAVPELPDHLKKNCS